ncbi:hypothetical protein LCB40_07760 [Lactobacillus corticis]|uniref:Uncharacterized protein n=1 Tax=Lactobacillus corticis TaxID=2201249 RepID=A0A916VHC4_9LACO|nr:hypothetical protein LCB40_07760 [Lactobacillus corticis]
MILTGLPLAITVQKSQAAYVAKKSNYKWKSVANIITGSTIFNKIISKLHWTNETPQGVHLMENATERGNNL